MTIDPADAPGAPPDRAPTPERSASRKKLSVVIPTYNEAGNIGQLWARVKAVLDRFDLDTEVLFVDDGSTDRSADLILEICRQDRRVKLIRLSRNFGHQAALTAGVDHVRADVVVLMDGDLQDKPEAIVDFVREWQAGYDIVYAIRASRQESWLRQLLFRFFYWILGRLSGIEQPGHAGIFSLADRRALDVIRSMPEHNRYFPGLRAYVGFRQRGIEVDRDARFAGEPRVGLRGLVKLAFDAIFSFSYVPIRLITLVGVIVAGGAFLFVLFVAYHKFVTYRAVPIWSSILSAVLILGGLQLIMLGILGEYVGRTYEETKRRPSYVVYDKTNFD